MDIEVEVKEEPVSFIDNEDETVVDLSPEKEKTETKSGDSERWQRAEDELARLRSEVSQTRHQVNSSTRQNVDPYAQQEETISERERALAVQFEADRASKGLTADRLKEYDVKSRGLQQERANIAAQRAIKGMLPDLLNAQRANQFQTEYADVHSNPAALRYAKGTYDQLLALGEPDGPGAVDKAMNKARIQFKLTGGKSNAPTDRDRQQLMGFGGNNGRQLVDNKVKMGKAEKSMAMAMYGDKFNGDEKKAYAQWAKGPGIRAKKEIEKSRRTDR